MKEVKLEICRSNSGREPFTNWFNKLDRTSRFRISAALFQLEEGNFSDSKFAGKGIWERRVHSGPGFRIYFAKRGKGVVVLLGGSTKSNQALQIQRAQSLWAKRKSNKEQ
jgi:putative addiction module killer protein